MTRKMDKPEGPSPLSRHMRYALIQNSIVQNGEYRRKLKEIGWDHQRKAGEILHGRSQAVRDHVITCFYSGQTHRRKPRMSISRDRIAMGKIHELSHLYLLQPKIKYSTLPPHSKDQKGVHNSPTLAAAIKTLVLSPQIDQFDELKKKKSQKDHSLLANFDKHSSLFLPLPTEDVPTLSRSRVLSNTAFDPMFRSVQSQQCKRWSMVTRESMHMLTHPTITDAGGCKRPSTTSSGTYGIRRRSCQFSTNAKSLIDLQRIQQISRMELTNKNRCFIPKLSLDSEKALKSNIEENERKESISVGHSNAQHCNEQSEKSQTIEKKVLNFYNALDSTHKREGKKWLKSNSKWRVIKQHILEKTLNASTEKGRKNEEITFQNYKVEDIVETLPSLKLSKRPNRKLSVKWSDSIPPDKN